MAGRTRTRSRGRKDGEPAEGGENDRACYAHRCARGEEESKAPSMIAAAKVEQVSKNFLLRNQ